MKRDDPPTASGLLGDLAAKPDVRELTIALGRADLYVNLARTVDLRDGHRLYEAILTDDNGSRVIYVDREDVAACLRESLLLANDNSEEPA